MNQKIKKQKGFIPIIIAIVVIALTGTGIGYGIGYSRASNVIREAQQLAKEEKYDQAIELLELNQNKWFIKNLRIKKQVINSEIEKNKKLFEDKTKYTQGIEEFEKGNWEEAKELLSKVSEDFPHYQETKNKIEEAEKRITGEQITEKITETEKEITKATCQDECSQVGLKRCYNIGNYGYQTCGNYDSDTCLEWSLTTICPPDTITCQAGICIQQGQKEQKCSDGTPYSQCSANKPKYCDNGTLIDNCNLCGCPADQSKCLKNRSCSQFSENVDCESKQYKMAFILLVKDQNNATSDRLTKLSWIKNEFSQNFYTATRNLASMDTKDDIYIMIDQPAFNAEATYPATSEITKKFYETHNDIYDFISVYTAFPTRAKRHHELVVQNIKGIGLPLPLFDNSETFGSSGKLKGVNFMGSIDVYSSMEEKKAALNGLLHETGHQWCCYVGNNFTRGQGGAKLEIIQHGMHFYLGLDCPYKEGCEVGSSDYWIPNGDGTFRLSKSISEPSFVVTKYHPFQLYFMGLLPKEEYDTKFWIYDAGIPGIEEWNWKSATPYKQVSVNDIIEVEGERECVLP